MDSALVGFYLSVYWEPIEEVRNLVASVHMHHPRSPVLIASDAGLEFADACSFRRCTALRYSSRTNTARNRPPYTFQCNGGMKRLEEALRFLRTPWVVAMDSDVRILGAIRLPPPGDINVVGNVINLWRSKNFSNLVARHSQRDSKQKRIGFACGGAPMLNSAALLGAMDRRLHDSELWEVAVQMEPLIAQEIDPCICATSYLSGLTVRPWRELLQFGGDYWVLGGEEYPRGVKLRRCAECIGTWKSLACKSKETKAYIIDTCSAWCPALLHDVKGSWCEYRPSLAKRAR